MNCDLGSNFALARRLLRLYKLAMVDGYRGVADQLLCALEQLARSEPACEPMLDHAYLWSFREHDSAASLRAPGPGPQ